MRITGARFLSGPNVHDDASGVVIGTDLASLPPAGQPFASPRDSSNPIFAALSIAGMADEWAATAVRGRAALPAFLLRLATALVTPASFETSIIGSTGTPQAPRIRFVRNLSWDISRDVAPTPSVRASNR